MDLVRCNIHLLQHFKAASDLAELDDNPYASPTAAADARRDDRTLEWQVATARAVRLVPCGVGYHAMLLMLGILPGPAPGTFVEIVVAGLSFAIWVPSLLYHGWFAGLLYGRLWGVLLAPLAAFPLVGLLALWMFDARARRELRACGWRVNWFAAMLPAKSS